MTDLCEHDKQAGVKKNSRKRLFLIIGVIAGAAAVLTAVFFLFIMPMLSGGGADPASLSAFEYGSDSYYSSRYLFKLNGDKAPDIVWNSGGIQDGSPAVVDPYRSAMHNRTVYQVMMSYDFEESFIKLEFSGAQTLKESQWVAPEVINSSPFTDLRGNTAKWVTAAFHLQADGNYLYFVLRPVADHMNDQWNIKGKLARIPLDGSRIEEVSGVNAFDFVIDGGGTGKRHIGDVGIYRIKPDGSEKQLLHAMTLPPKQASESMSPFFNIGGRMEMIGGKLYFLDFSAEGQGRLLRMSPDGSDAEYVSKSAAAFYTVDTDHGAAYYETTTYSDDCGFAEYDNPTVPEMAKYDFSSKTEESVPYVKSHNYGASYYDGYLYIVNLMAFHMIDDFPCGLRMNVSSGAYEGLIYHDPAVSGEKTDNGKDGPYLTWEPAAAD